MKVSLLTKFVLSVCLISCINPLFAQEAVLLKTQQGFTQLSAWNCSSYGCNTITSSATCTSDSCSLSQEYAIDHTSTQIGHQATLSAQNFSVSDYHRYKTTSRDSASESDYAMNLYAKVAPNANLRIKINGSAYLLWKSSQICGGNQVATRASIGFTNSSYGGGISVSSEVSRSGVAGTVNSQLYLSVSTASLPQSPVSAGGETYYYVGQVKLIGRLGVNACWFSSGASYEAEGRANAEVVGIDVRYAGNVLYKIDGDTQTWRTNKELPRLLKIRVLDGETGAPYSNAPITFWLTNTAMKGKFENGGVSITTNTLTDGTAWVRFTLGDSTGTYTITASCPANVCTSGVRQVTFTEEAKGTKLACVDCELHGKVSAIMRNPFRLRVIDTVDGSVSTGVPVTYDLIRFEDVNGFSGTNWHGGLISAILDPVTDKNGLSRAIVRLGSEEGTYVVRARCESCAEGQEAIMYGIAHSYDVTPDVEKVLSADPDANEDDCPSGCCPRTPVVRTQMVSAPNDGKSFTSASGENTVTLNTQVLPTCLGNSSNVTWEVADAPGDYIYSGTPTQPGSGQTTSFTVGSGDFPKADTGRPLPLAYKVTAKVMRGSTPYYATARVKQDEIDKCRQEYLDWGNGDLGKLIMDVPRSKFSIGVEGDFDKYKDCYANIYPEKGIRAVNSVISAGYKIRINSGYRSPRHNMISVNSSTSSVHLFGEAVDIVPVNGTPTEWRSIWDALKDSCPKVLEYDKNSSILYCDSDGVIRPGSKFYLSGADDPDDLQVFSVQKNCIHIGPRKH